MSTTEDRQDTEVIPEEEVSPAIAELGPQPQTDVPDSTPEVRLRTLTERGEDAYVKNRDKFCKVIERSWTTINSMCQEAGTIPENLDSLSDAEETLDRAFVKYKGHVEQYIDFLKGTRTQQSDHDLDTFDDLARLRHTKISAVLRSLQDRQEALKRPKSVRSKSRHSSQSGSSQISDVSSLARRKSKSRSS